MTDHDRSNARGRGGRTEARLISALLTERSYADAAAKAGCSEATLYRRLRDPAFTKKYRAARREVLEVAIGQLQQATAEAVKTLVQALQSADAHARIRA